MDNGKLKGNITSTNIIMCDTTALTVLSTLSMLSQKLHNSTANGTTEIYFKELKLLLKWIGFKISEATLGIIK